MTETTQSAFRHNAQVALQDGTFEDGLSALVMKLQELGVFDENAAEEVRMNYEPLARTFLRPRDQEARNRAWDDISACIFQLGGLLPPEASDGAFLADRTQVKALLDKRTNFLAQKVVAEMNEERAAGPSHADERDEEGDGGARPFEGDIFEGLGESGALIRSFYTGDPVTNAEADKRGMDRQFFRDALIGDPSLGNVTTMDVIDADAMNKLIWASEHNTTNDILWAMSLKLVELGKADTIIEQDTADTIHVLSVARNYAAKREDPLFRRRAIDILRKELIRFVGVLPRGVWKNGFLDNREDVLKLIGDRAQKSIGAA